VASGFAIQRINPITMGIHSTPVKAKFDHHAASNCKLPASHHGHQAIDDEEQDGGKGANGLPGAEFHEPDLEPVRRRRKPMRRFIT
jgi:hypothetical protein